MVEIVVDSFLREDLHAFLTENQLGEIIGTFPAAFCGGDHIWRHFNRTAQTMHFRNTLCALNVTQLTMDFDEEFVEYEGGVFHFLSLKKSQFDDLVFFCNLQIKFFFLFMNMKMNCFQSLKNKSDSLDIRCALVICLHL